MMLAKDIWMRYGYWMTCKEALELIEFDPSVDPTASQSHMLSFLEKHFNRSLTDEEREAILKEFP